MLFLLSLFALATSAGLLGFIFGVSYEIEHEKKTARHTPRNMDIPA